MHEGLTAGQAEHTQQPQQRQYHLALRECLLMTRCVTQTHTHLPRLSRFQAAWRMAMEARKQ